jgi:hypothetical protein
LLVFATGVMNVIVTGSRGKESTYMKTFTIDAENTITVFASKKEAAFASGTPFDPFTSQSELAELAAEWPTGRLIAIWNGIPGVLPVKKFTDRKVATDRIWKAIQSLELPQAESAVETPEPTVIETPVEEPAAPATERLPEREAEPASAEEQPVQEAVVETEPVAAEELPNTSEETPDTAPVTPEPSTEPTAPKKAPRAKKAAKSGEAAGPREGSKTAQVVALLKREGGATLEEIMLQMGWQKHTVRGFIAGSMKKAGYTVGSFKSEAGARSYRIHP